MPRRARQLRRRRARGGGGRLLFGAFGAAVGVLVIGACAGIGYIASLASSAPSIGELKPVDQGAISIVYAADGKTRLGYIQGDTLRSPVSASRMPLSVRQATVAIEDRRFYQHQGVDFEGVVRAAIKNISSHKTVQGGSTLTMQLIRNLYQGDRSRTLKRKVREAKLASELEDQHPGRRGKEWILTQYLNNVPYGTVGGQTAVGIEAASRVFFDKPARRLTLAESALLAGLPQAPSDYNPFLDEQAARERRDQVLQQMARSGYISDGQATAAMREPLGVKKNAFYAKRRESYFFDYVRKELVRRYGEQRVHEGGMRVTTTVDLKLQQVARQAIAAKLPNPGDPSAALVSIDPKSGYIKAMASSSDYGVSKFNLAVQARRQPGSTFKVMVLMTALRNGVDINKTSYVSKPLKFVDEGTGTPIDVQTDDHRYGGRTTLFQGLVRSDNTVYQQADLDLGPENVRQTAYDMGITSHLDAFPAEGLGGLTRGVSPLEMTRAYATINTGGWRITPIAVKKVVLPGGRVDTSLARRHRVKFFTDGETAEATKAMEANVQGGTGTRAQLSGCPAAGKTGTTSSFTDAWFDGFTTSLNTAVWVGYPESTRSMVAVPGYGEMFGGLAPAEIWHDFMASAMSTRTCKPFPEPREPFVAVPFFGKYATTGAPGGAVDELATGTTGAAAPAGKDGKQKGKDGKYPPSKYEAPPQKAPHVKTPKPAPAVAPAPGVPPSGGTAAPAG